MIGDICFWNERLSTYSIHHQTYDDPPMDRYNKQMKMVQPIFMLYLFPSSSSFFNWNTFVCLVLSTHVLNHKWIWDLDLPLDLQFSLIQMSCEAMLLYAKYFENVPVLLCIIVYFYITNSVVIQQFEVKKKQHKNCYEHLWMNILQDNLSSTNWRTDCSMIYIPTQYTFTVAYIDSLIENLPNIWFYLIYCLHTAHTWIR